MRMVMGIGLLAVIATAAHAMEPYTCRNGLFPAAAGQVREASVQGGPQGRSWLRGDAKGCPDSDACIGKSYVVHGDRVLVSTESEGWSCAWYSGKKVESVGWLPSAELAPLASRAPVVRDWVGRWEPIGGGGDRIVIVAANGGAVLRLRGRANWTGGVNGFGERVVHLGEFAGDATPAGDLLTVVDDACTVRMQWVADSLVVADNGSCGGMNVRFDDVYRKRRR